MTLKNKQSKVFPKLYNLSTTLDWTKENFLTMDF